VQIECGDPFVKPSFSFGNRLYRAIWGGVWLFLFRFSPRPFHAWRSFLLRLFGAKIGRDVHIYPSVTIWSPQNLEVGDRVGIGQDAVIYCMGRIVIASNVVVSQGVHLCSGSHDYNSPNFQLFTKAIYIGSHTWLCADTFVAPGVTIADGSVIGARGVVVKSIVDSWKIWAGSPIRLVGERDRKRVLGE